MAMEQYFQEMASQFELNGNGSSLKSWNSMSPSVDEPSENNNSGGFECNICLDSVQDPVVTMCGHLYCWPCIYKWIHYQTTSSENSDHQEPQCPVCKVRVSEKTLIPLYGPGLSTKPSDGKAANLGIVIPQRPPSPRCTAPPPITSTTNNNSNPGQQLHHRNYPQPHQQYRPYPGGYMASPVLPLGGTTTNVPHPMVGMFGEMVYARIFGNSETTVYAYPNSYHLAGSASPRVRRHIMEVDKSLGRLSFFLFCCMVLCLLLF